MIRRWPRASNYTLHSIVNKGTFLRQVPSIDLGVDTNQSCLVWGLTQTHSDGAFSIRQMEIRITTAWRRVTTTVIGSR